MPDYTAQTDVHAPADAVFKYIADVKNLPKYLPTVHSAAPQPGERVQVEGTANKHDYSSDGWFKTDAKTRTVTWGSDGENDYHGVMNVTGDGSHSHVKVTITFSPRPDVAHAMEKNQGGQGAAMQDGLQTAMENIRHQCEGAGGKQHSSAER